MTVIVTGAAGFVGMNTVQRLLDRGETVVGVDNFNTYYDPALKAARATKLEGQDRFRMARMDIADASGFAALVKASGAKRIIHLAAQAGVRYSLENPFAYERSNLAGHLSVLEACRHNGVEHLVYASSSSVYGDRPQDGEGFKESDAAVEPVSLYAATKRSGELMSHSYGRLYGLSQTGLRFFTVYGPMGRPDMAYFSFTQKILAGEPIEVFGQGEMSRDFTYVDDIVTGVVAALDHVPPAGENRILNIGGGRPEGLMDMISTLEKAIGREAVKIYKPMQPGDVPRTFADVSKLKEITGYTPAIPIEEGLPRFVEWYRSFYG
ncbi:NAD-dependent epimerase/dehydratase family protein [Caulobacter segnis]|uniref:NAD-dependent epimerase/dehydratase family protein n=1 Tax=Caulobacter segnis TaxID=88688 RepID=UPI00240F44D9|nr:NAD-dependent epimerase/dehydratase family protein [Caulobacter segnis]MDG2520502.1 NAD-dependent epimerase/dehydratase family protein [Caulobacter segnis]